MPLHRHNRRLRPLPPEPSLRHRFRTATFRTRSVLAVPPGFDGLLRRACGPKTAVLSTVCRFVAPCSRSWGSPGFRAPVLLFGSPRTWCSAVRSLSHWRRPFEAFPSPAAVHLVTAGCLLLAKEIRVHRVNLPSRRLDHRASFRVATATTRASSTSGPFSTGESVADSERFRPAQLDAPMGFGSTRSDACRARGADLWSTGRFTLVGSNAAGCPHHPRVMRKARFSACLAPMADAGASFKSRSSEDPRRRSSSLTARRLLRFRSARPRPW